jgi:hypothetical protein
MAAGSQGVLPRSRYVSVKSRLKLKSPSELDTPRCIALGEDFPKRRVTPVHVRCTPQMAIEYVPYVGDELEIDTFGNLGRLGDTEVLVEVVWKTNR